MHYENTGKWEKIDCGSKLVMICLQTDEIGRESFVAIFFKFEKMMILEKAMTT